MRKVKLQMQVSIDGFVAGQDGAMDWMVWDWDEALKNYVAALTEPVDCILLGRVLAEGFIPTWASRLADPATADAFARKMVDTPKVVFSKKTAPAASWPNTRVSKAIPDEIRRLKQAPGGDIMVYGGAGLVAGLIQEGWIDEYHLFVNPVALGIGMPVFTGKTTLRLQHAQAFDCGIVLQVYVPALNKLE